MQTIFISGVIEKESGDEFTIEEMDEIIDEISGFIDKKKCILSATFMPANENGEPEGVLIADDGTDTGPLQ